ncbi:hypothetical protein [Listeria booriae]|uniref:hypothetical protein n=1 Tax=Listeria booriae TaxID=1552123 RepID=UPI0016234E15|nr:hypothetical protein [Listeria booriae]MBC2391348.1 hypothetical protein [Listeria booriae]
MSKSELTKTAEYLIYQEWGSKLGTFCCDEVMIGNQLDHHGIVDYLIYDTKGIWRCYEIKVTLADFRSAALKTFVGNYNYYVLPFELYQKVKHEIPNQIGVICFDRIPYVQKRPKKQELAVDKEVMYYSLIKSLARERNKLMKWIYFDLEDSRYKRRD